MRSNRQASRANRIAVSFWRLVHADRRASLFLPLAFLCLLALVSYDARDPSWNTASAAASGIQNWLGSGGALLADLLVQLFGKGSWLFVCLLASLSVKSSRGVFFRGACLSASVILVASANALLLPEATTSWPAGGGGITGELVRNVAYSDSNKVNLIAIVSALAAASGLFLAATPGLPRAFFNGVGGCFSFVREKAQLLRETSHALGKNLGQPLEPPLERRLDQPFADRDADRDEDDALLLRQPVTLEDTFVEQEGRIARGISEGMSEEAMIGSPQESADIATDMATGMATGVAGSDKTNSEPMPTGTSPALRLPPLSLLSSASEDRQGEQSADELQTTSELLEKTLSDYGVRGTITDVQRGPVITLYALEPVAGVKASRVVSLAEDIARTMRRVSVRIAIIPGKNGIGIELPNPARQTVVLGELLASSPRSLFLPLALGKGIDGTAQVVDLADMPHLLIAGTTGAGKSVGINAMILSLLYRHAPEDCRLILIDPKMLELSAYQDIPHLLAPVITDHEKALSALRWAASEMERRYRLMASVGARNVEGYRRKRLQRHKTGDAGLSLENMPYIVIIVDEMADLMLTSGRNIEMVLQRLAQMARAAGIHMIVATQRPSVDVITGTIKANFPTRISYRVASKFDSRTILNEQGAEMLLGRGDMLFMPGGGKLTRIHGPFVGEEEVETVCNFLRAQAPANYVAEVLASKGKPMAATLEGNDEDPLYLQAIKIVVKHQRASTSFLQRQLQIGYNRAARIIERMEEEGHIGLADGTGKRSVLRQQLSDDPNDDLSRDLSHDLD